MAKPPGFTGESNASGAFAAQWLRMFYKLPSVSFRDADGFMNPGGAADWRSIAVICSAVVIFPHPLGSSVNRPVSFQLTLQDIIRNSLAVLLPLDAPVFHYLWPPPSVRAAQNRIVGEISCRSCRICPRGSPPSRAGARPGAWGFCREVSIPMEARPFYSGFCDHHVQFPLQI